MLTLPYTQGKSYTSGKKAAISWWELLGLVNIKYQYYQYHQYAA